MKTFIYSLLVVGSFTLVSCGDDAFDTEPVRPTEPEERVSAYITKVFDYMPAVGQFTNVLPQYEDGDTQETMNDKVLEAIGNNKRGMISLGGFGGYIVVGFDHTVQNVPGKKDFRVLGNAFYESNGSADGIVGGSSEPGVIMVALDKNQNGKPDEDEWFEIAGSSHVDPTKEPWYEKAVVAGNDVNTYFDYEITYYRPAKEPSSSEEKYIQWEDNRGNKGYKAKNVHHKQSYFPKWIKGNELSFKGTRLPQNGIDKSGNGSNFVLYKFLYGYADNAVNDKEDACIDIDWAVDKHGMKVDLPGIDFIKIYTGVNQENGNIGEISTEITGIEDLHVLEAQK